MTHIQQLCNAACSSFITYWKHTAYRRPQIPGHATPEKTDTFLIPPLAQNQIDQAWGTVCWELQALEIIPAPRFLK